MDKKGSEALYRRLYTKLRDEIRFGFLKAGDAFPTEESLCEKYSLSRVTVRKALALLTDEGYLTRKRGIGTSVRLPNMLSDSPSITSFQDYCKRAGHEAETRVISVALSPANRQDMTMLKAQAGESVLSSCRIRLCDGEPVVLEYNRYSKALSFLTESALSGSLYTAMLEKGYSVASASHVVSIRYADAETAQLLSVPKGSALLYLLECMYDEKHTPLHTSEQFIRGDRFAFRI
ncbi:MAG: GntR family transcriptional regulator [Eubacteriales bacterium]|nr:GntR family transcriptional regulator [Eubacteriales bacterium]MDD3881102.1 GntR family transcriptional regulator [Eubacteriales bacterium]